MYLSQNVQEITIAHIETLITNRVSEGRLIDFKGEWSVKDNEEKKEFLHDLTSFANTMGGHIIFGIREEQKIAKEIVGIGSSVDAEKAIGVMEDLALNSVSPRHASIKYKHIAGPNGGVIVGYIPSSWGKPHLVTFGGYWRAFARRETGKYPLSVEQFKGMVQDSGEVSERIKRFRLERVSKILSGEAPRELQLVNGQRSALLIHIIPIDSFGFDSIIFSPKDLSEGTVIYQYLTTIAKGTDIGFNFDGLIISGPGTNGYIGYNQVFRNGVIEVADTKLMGFKVKDMQAIMCPHFEVTTTNKIKTLLEFYRTKGISLPFAVIFSLVGVKDYKCINEQGWGRFHDFRNATSLFGQDLLLFREVVIEDSDYSESKLYMALKPVFDALWNASGVASCPFYSQTENDWEFKGKVN